MQMSFIPEYFAMQMLLISKYFALQLSLIHHYFAMQILLIPEYFAMQMSLIPKFLVSSVFVNLNVIKLLHIITLLTFYLTTVSVILSFTSTWLNI